MHTFLQALLEDHKRLLALLVVLERQLENFHVQQEHDLDLACELVQYINSFAAQVHHPTEDLMFARFKTLYISDCETVDLMLQQHKDIVSLTKKFHNALQSLLQGDIIPRHDVEILGQTMLRLLREHVAVEERELFPLINARLAAIEWQALESLKAVQDLRKISERPNSLRVNALLRHLAN